MLWLFFEREGRELITGSVRFLHFAPEECLAARFRAMPNLSYVTADLRRCSAAVHFDIATIPYENDSFDLILCSHVLEHVDNDRVAMRELHRVLRPGGSAIILVPIDERRATTFEDAAVTSPEERERTFGQFDHVRRYGRDFPSRLEDAGFRIAIDRYVQRLDQRLVERHGCYSSGMWVCAKFADTG